VYDNFFNTGFFGTVHETGHALYVMGNDPALARTLLVDGASLAIHESQSRLYENLICQSLPFWIYYYPRLRALFMDQLEHVPLEEFFRRINSVEPTLIHDEADEATHNLHTMLCPDLEIAFVEGTLEVKELPSMWNA